MKKVIAFWALTAAASGCVTTPKPQKEKPKEVTRCGPFQAKGFDGEFTEVDGKAIERAKYVCQTQYKGCLILFVKTGYQSYRAICRRLEEDSSDVDKK